LRIKEPPIDLWIFGVALALGCLLILLNWNHLLAVYQSMTDQEIEWLVSSFGLSEKDRELVTLTAQMDMHAKIESTFMFQLTVYMLFFVAVLFVAALRRGRTGRL
jgi:hypothetical protein